MADKKAKLFLDRMYTVGELDPRIYGSFVEHMERVVYEGIYEPDHPLADEKGFRKDVIELVRELDIPFIRYPGGNFVSGYNWEDGIGPKDERPIKKELAWCAYETNQVGVDEFMYWADKVGTQVNMAVNLGTRGPDAARNLVEYCNGLGNTYWSKLRVENGHSAPYNIKTWCLGNEMDGDWQLGHKTAEEYGRIAHETAKVMLKTDPNIDLVACGSSNAVLGTYPEWDAVVLDHTYDLVDYLSMHNYYTSMDTDTPTFLAYGIDMARQIEDISATADYIKAKKRSKKTMYFSFDEWGVWSKEERVKRVTWQYSWDNAGYKTEGHYSFEDALLTGSLLNTLINHCDRVKCACQSMLMNHISLFSSDKGGPIWKQTIFYPFLHASRYGRGIALRPVVVCDCYKTERHGDVPVLDVAAVINEEKDELNIFILNRDTENAVDLDLDFVHFDGKYAPQEHIAYEDYDLGAYNSAEGENVVPVSRQDIVSTDAGMFVRLTPASWNVLRLSRP